ncbi:MAG: 4-(cytidine 5'-diphospho)-2-C-methyl-D-erythritol kinase [Pseudomonadota bacterium]
MEALAPAKVNLYLHVGPPKADGRHDLCSWTVFADHRAADRLTVAAAPDFSLQVEGPTAGDAGAIDDNLVARAAKALAGAAGIAPGVSITLEKRLPVAAGIGGGSADAGAALRLLRTLWSVGDVQTCLDIAAGLGGDVPAAFVSRPVLMRGEGERVSPAPPAPPLPAVLVNPGFPCPTGPVFRRYDESAPAALVETDPPGFETTMAAIDWLAGQRNDLESPALALAPDIQGVLDALASLQGARLVRMSGSGATCFALFESEDAAVSAAAGLSEARPEWWVRPTLLGGLP